MVEGTLDEQIAFFRERVQTFSNIVNFGGNIKRTMPSLIAAREKLEELLSLQAQVLTEEQEGNIIEGKKTNSLLIPALIIGALVLL